MKQQNFTEILKKILSISVRWLWVFLLSVVVAGTAAYFVSSRLTPIYQASSMILIDQAPDSRSTQYQAILTSERLTQTYATMIMSRPVMTDVIDRLELDLDVNELSEDVKILPIRDTQIIRIQVENSDPVLAATIANTIAEVFSDTNQIMQKSRFAESKSSLQSQLDLVSEQIEITSNSLSELDDQQSDPSEKKDLESSLTQYEIAYSNLLQSYEDIRSLEAQSTSEIIQIDEAIPPEKPIRPKVISNTILAAVFGGVIAVTAILLIEAWDDTIKEPEVITNEFQLPLLGLITRFDPPTDGPVALAEPRSQISEAFRALRTNIQYASFDLPNRQILVTSPSPGEGKTTISTNLAVVIAQGERQVVLVDADFRRPSIHKSFKISNHQGFSQIFVNPELSKSLVTQNDELYNLSILTSGPIPPNPSELLSSDRVEDIFANIMEDRDFLVVDTTPTISVTDAIVLGSRVDGVLLVVRWGSTTRGDLRRSIEQIHQIGGNILGVVMNDVKITRTSYYNYERYVYSSYGYRVEKRA